MNLHKRILILSDDFGDKLQAKVAWSDCLKSKYSEIVYCYSVVDLVTHVRANTFDLIFVDLHKSCEYVVDVVHYIREKTRLDIWILIDEVKPLDTLSLLKAGADNCLQRSLHQDEILMRVEVLFRRKYLDKVSEGEDQLQLNDFLLCRDKRELYYYGHLITTTGIEFELLNILMTNNGDVVSREVIARNIFKRNLLYCSQSINMHISNIRRKLRAINNKINIKSVRGSGYVLITD